MPLAGTDREARARAHYRWAQRYAKKGERMDQAIAHFGRALDYTRFGAHDIRLGSYDAMLEKYEHFDVATATNTIARFPDSSRENERTLYDEMRADAGSRLIPGPLRTHVAPKLEVDVDVGVRPGEQESIAAQNGKAVKVNILGNILWKLSDVLAKPTAGPYRRPDDDIKAGRYTADALHWYSEALGDPFRVSSAYSYTTELEAKDKADLCAMLRDRYRELRVKPTNSFISQREGDYRYWIIPFVDETKSSIKTQIVKFITIQGADGVSYQLVFCTNGFIYWFGETP
jgi:hypothetical protein